MKFIVGNSEHFLIICDSPVKISQRLKKASYSVRETTKCGIYETSANAVILVMSDTDCANRAFRSVF